MRTADKQIADILVRYGEPFGGNVWRVQGTAVIYHKTSRRPSSGPSATRP
jgi:hypothetical protein